MFIDARSIEDFTNGHIFGSRSLSWHDVDLHFIGVTQDLDLETQIITYCDGETCELSHDLALFLRDAGFMSTRVLVNGWTVWQQKGLPVEYGAHLPPKSEKTSVGVAVKSSQPPLTKWGEGGLRRSILVQICHSA